MITAITIVTTVLMFNLILGIVTILNTELNNFLAKTAIVLGLIDMTLIATKIVVEINKIT